MARRESLEVLQRRNIVQRHKSIFQQGGDSSRTDPSPAPLPYRRQTASKTSFGGSSLSSILERRRASAETDSTSEQHGEPRSSPATKYTSPFKEEKRGSDVSMDGFIEPPPAKPKTPLQARVLGRSGGETSGGKALFSNDHGEEDFTASAAFKPAAEALSSLLAADEKEEFEAEEARRASAQSGSGGGGGGVQGRASTTTTTTAAGAAAVASSSSRRSSLFGRASNSRFSSFGGAARRVSMEGARKASSSPSSEMKMINMAGAREEGERASTARQAYSSAIAAAERLSSSGSRQSDAKRVSVSPPSHRASLDRSAPSPSHPHPHPHTPSSTSVNAATSVGISATTASVDAIVDEVKRLSMSAENARRREDEGQQTVYTSGRVEVEKETRQVERVVESESNTAENRESGEREVEKAVPVVVRRESGGEVRAKAGEVETEVEVRRDGREEEEEKKEGNNKKKGKTIEVKSRFMQNISRAPPKVPPVAGPAKGGSAAAATPRQPAKAGVGAAKPARSSLFGANRSTANRATSPSALFKGMSRDSARMSPRRVVSRTPTPTTPSATASVPTSAVSPRVGEGVTNAKVEEKRGVTAVMDTPKKEEESKDKKEGAVLSRREMLEQHRLAKANAQAAKSNAAANAGRRVPLPKKAEGDGKKEKAGTSASARTSIISRYSTAPSSGRPSSAGIGGGRSRTPTDVRSKSPSPSPRLSSTSATTTTATTAGMVGKGVTTPRREEGGGSSKPSPRAPTSTATTSHVGGGSSESGGGSGGVGARKTSLSTLRRFSGGTSPFARRRSVDEGEGQKKGEERREEVVKREVEKAERGEEKATTAQTSKKEPATGLDKAAAVTGKEMELLEARLAQWEYVESEMAASFSLRERQAMEQLYQLQERVHELEVDARERKRNKALNDRLDCAADLVSHFADVMPSSDALRRHQEALDVTSKEMAQAHATLPVDVNGITQEDVTSQFKRSLAVMDTILTSLDPAESQASQLSSSMEVLWETLDKERRELQQCRHLLQKALSLSNKEKSLVVHHIQQQ
uniref:Uncharacterized protein n=1 Tax=Palpitomonas bilix TaxID=652834 RepID=A0A7S3GLP2_9EUKA|mmetsp:Transcript_8662/g.23296  ORF Transcript_8662/g.23296 Transcript_8662/m.23296 type:complete len:1037 (+) Transcript_8662:52-3162(+)